MAKIYCLQCNFGNEYSSSRPNFCGKCGKPFIDSAKASQPQQNQYQDLIKMSQPAAPSSYQESPKHRGRLNRIVNPDEDIDYPDDATKVPQIDKIECELTVDNLRPNRQNGKDVFTSGSQSEAAEILGKKPIKVSKNPKINKQQLQKEVQEQFKTQLVSKKGQQRESTEITG